MAVDPKLFLHQYDLKVIRTELLLERTERIVVRAETDRGSVVLKVDSMEGTLRSDSENAAFRIEPCNNALALGPGGGVPPLNSRFKPNPNPKRLIPKTDRDGGVSTFTGREAWADHHWKSSRERWKPWS